VLAATPLGNPADASMRLREVLAKADVIAAEDTRRLRRLTAALEIEPRGRVLSYYDANERERAGELVDEAQRGSRVAVVTDAGMPSISDPGYRVVAEAIERGVPVTAIPGPSAVLMALAISGLPVDRFCFEGFLPRKQGERSTRIAELVDEPRTMVFFEAPHRVEAALTALAEVLGVGRRAAVCREMTKTYEEVRRGTLAELRDWAGDGVLGECTIVVAGASQEERRAARGLLEPADWVEAVREREAQGSDRRSAIAAVAKEAGVQRRLVYDAVVTAKQP
jgi:16S rRNA (cytidine1402-2'-O)-methyltransferase